MYHKRRFISEYVNNVSTIVTPSDSRNKLTSFVSVDIGLSHQISCSLLIKARLGEVDPNRHVVVFTLVNPDPRIVTLVPPSRGPNEGITDVTTNVSRKSKCEEESIEVIPPSKLNDTETFSIASGTSGDSQTIVSNDMYRALDNTTFSDVKENIQKRVSEFTKCAPRIVIVVPPSIEPIEGSIERTRAELSYVLNTQHVC